MMQPQKATLWFHLLYILKKHPSSFDEKLHLTKR